MGWYFGRSSDCGSQNATVFVTRVFGMKIASLCSSAKKETALAQADNENKVSEVLPFILYTKTSRPQPAAKCVFNLLNQMTG